MRIPCVLSIAGSDSGGGAGIQADLKAFAACGVHGMTAITAITAQSTVGVLAIHAIPPELIRAQVRAVLDDIGIDAVKIGMLGDVTTVEAVAAALDSLARGTPVVLDPVMVSESGAELLDPSARRALIELLLPRIDVLTPNILEAEALMRASEAAALVGASGVEAPLVRASGVDTPSGDPTPSGGPTPPCDPAGLARAIHALGPRAVVVTGGHRDAPTDVFFDGARLRELPGERYADGAAHGSGCTHSSVLAARLAWGDDPFEAARVAKELAARAVRDGLRDVGSGPGPVDILGIRDRTGRPPAGPALTRADPTRALT